jgi:orotate phosphoribosyltransferase
MADLQPWQKQLIEVSIEAKALKFEEAILKSGRQGTTVTRVGEMLMSIQYRVSPYFFNAGRLSSGSHLFALANGYANLIATHFKDSFDVIFGPAYKGIPFAACTALLLHQNHGISIGYAYDRKEVKAHGEGGSMVGTPLKEKRVLILDDVMTAGTAVRNSMEMIQKEGGKVVGFVMCLDREEIGPNGESTVKNVEEAIGRPGSFKSILKLSDLLGWLEKQGTAEQVQSMIAYREKYGVKQQAMPS